MLIPTIGIINKYILTPFIATAVSSGSLLNISTNDIKELENSINSETNRIIEGLCQIIDIYVMELEMEGYELLRGEEKDIDELLAYIQIKINTYEECKKVIKDIEIAWEVEIKKDENDNKYYIDIAAEF